MLAVILAKITDHTKVKQKYDSSGIILMALGIKNLGLLRLLRPDTHLFGWADV